MTEELQTPDELEFERRLCDRIRDSALYRPMTDETFCDVQDSLNSWLRGEELVESYDVFVAREYTEDALARECESFEQYKVRAAALGADVSGVGEREFRKRRHVTKPGCAYVEVSVVMKTGRKFRFELTVGA